MSNNITEKLIADTIAADVYIHSVFAIESENNITVDIYTGSVIVLESESNIIPESIKTETIISSGERGPTGINEEDIVYAKRVDFVGDTTIYKAEAVVGSLDTSAVWRIRKITIASDSDIIEQWANGNANFINIWNDRVSLSYT